MAAGHGRADYLLFVDGKAVGTVEAEPSGTPLAAIESQSATRRGSPKVCRRSCHRCRFCASRPATRGPHRWVRPPGPALDR